MGLKKCPRCELNYIQEDEKYCEVCRREIKGERDADDAVTICVECGENAAVKGSEYCAICLREARRQERLLKAAGGEDTIDLTQVELDDIEVPLPVDGEIPESELEVMDKELGDGDEDEDNCEEDEVGEENGEEDGDY